MGLDQEEVVYQEMTIHVALDRLTATLNVKPCQEGEQEISVAMVEEKLSELGICYGVDLATLNQWESASEEIEVVIASGKPAEKGENGKILFHFPIEKEIGLQEDEKGRIDFKNLGIIENVHRHDVLCTIQLPTQGMDGIDVYGNAIEGIMGDSVTIPQGSNTEVSADGLQLLASCVGHVVYQGGLVQVKTLYEIDGDVDATTGNIFFWGSVLVRGDVREGFTIIADGDVVIKGTVEAAKIKAGGDIKVNNGVNGMGKGILDSGADVYCGYIENSTINTKGSLYAEVILNSSVNCQGNIELKGRKAALIGGSHEVAGWIEGKSIGSPNALPTTIKFKPAEENNHIVELVKEQQKLLTEIEERNKKIMLFLKLEKMGRLKGEKRLELVTFINEQKQEQNQLQEIEKKIEEEKKKQGNARRLLVRCKSCIHEGTRISTHRSAFLASQELPNCSLYEDKEGITVGSR